MADTLFDDDESSPRVAAPVAPTAGPPDWLLTQLRGLLDEQGVSDMGERRQLVARLVGREVPSLRDLTTGEAQQLVGDLHRLGPSGTAPTQASAWDSRDEDTWIDRL